MTQNRCLTLVGLPCLREFDAEPFELRARMVRLPAPPPRVITHVRLRVQPPTPASGPLKEFAVSAAIVFALGCAMIGWLL